MRAVNRVKPAIPPIFAMSSARSFSFSCSGVGSGSPRRAAGWAVRPVSRNQGRIPKLRTHHDTTVETLLTDSDDDIFAIAFEDLGTGNHETIGVGVGGVEFVNVGTLPFGLFPERNTLIVGDLLDGVGLSSCAGFVAPDVVAGNEYTVARDDLARLEKGDVTNEEVLDVDNAFISGADNLDTTFLLLVVENTELLFLLPIIEGTNHHLWE